ncbi:hypothetical protein [Aquimarina pacifica]|uniref:hypothetical protein n=1 Tax=Aquimarina pacifica TaxID=1296415 RepID=UPI0004711DF1|nr:hypothetical protein [Aquimarina pacifica]
MIAKNQPPDLKPPTKQQQNKNMIRTTYSQLTTVQKALVCYKIIKHTRAEEQLIQKILEMMDPQIKVIGGEVIVWHGTLELIKHKIKWELKKEEERLKETEHKMKNIPE